MPEIQLSEWTTLDPAAGWQITTGSFRGGTTDDLLAYQPGNGSLWLGRNAGDRFEFSSRSAIMEPASGWEFAAGDVTGSGPADVVGYSPSNGTVWVAENRGPTLAFQQWATLAPATGWHIGTGFFAGNAKADLLAHHDTSGTLWVGSNTGSRFAFTGTWATVDAGHNWQFVTEDFIGDGRTDVAGYDPTDGGIWVGENGGSSFALTRWATLEPADGWHIVAGRFTGRDKADLLGYHADTGRLWIGVNSGRTFSSTWPAAELEPPDGWQFVAGRVNGDAWGDIVGYHPGNGSVWAGQLSVRPIEGYCWPLSAAPGESIAFHLSGSGESVASFQRHVSTSTEVESVPVDSLTFTASEQAVPAAPWRTGCGWEQAFTVTLPPDWRSGIYSASCTDSVGTQCDVTFVVKPAPQRRSRIAVLANVNTWLAYNGWGGQSKYTGLARTSFLRPAPSAAPDGELHLTRGELWILGWLERQGQHPDVYTDIDFHNDGCDAHQYPCLVVGTHPEYWTERMYDQLESYLDAGGSLLYLGGNGVFEIGDYDNDQTEMVFRAGIEGGPRAPALFRNRGRPERSLLGVASERCGVTGTPYVVRSPDHPLFAGTGVSDGDTFGGAGLNTGKGNGQASGWEVDTSRGPGATGTPASCDLDPGPVPPSVLPAGLVVLATGLPDAAGLGADMTYYDHPGGGFVFSAGSLTFGGSLVVDEVASGLTHNLLQRAGITS